MEKKPQDLKKEKKTANSLAESISYYGTMKPSLLKKLQANYIVFKLKDHMDESSNKKRKELEDQIKRKFVNYTILTPLNLMAVFLLMPKMTPRQRVLSTFIMSGGLLAIIIRPVVSQSLTFSEEIINNGILEKFATYKAELELQSIK